MGLDVAAAGAALDTQVGEARGLATEESALAVINIAVNMMGLAVRQVSVERGVDPRDCVVVELLFAVRTTLSRRELVAEPFILVGIIASLKEIVVLSVKAPDLLGRPEFADLIWLIGVLTATIIILSISGYLLRRKEREPTEGDRNDDGRPDLTERSQPEPTPGGAVRAGGGTDATR
jgi:hypothetical protein